MWAEPSTRVGVARAMFAIRFGEEVKARTLDMLRGMEGARLKRMYELTAQRYGVPWQGRRYDRNNPNAADIPNQAINHAASAVEAAAAIAVASTATIPQLGFVHEDSGQSFVLDIADLVRHDVMLPIAFGAAKQAMRNPSESIDRLVRTRAAETFNKEQVVAKLIDHIKALIGPAEPAAASEHRRPTQIEPPPPRRRDSMPLCIVVTRDVEMRYRGFLGSVMLELAPGVYAGPRMSKGVRERVWDVLSSGTVSCRPAASSWRGARPARREGSGC